MEADSITSALYFVGCPGLTQIITKLVKICTEKETEQQQYKQSLMYGVFLRHKIRTVSRGLRLMGISTTFQMADVLKPDAKQIKFYFSRAIYFFEYLENFKRLSAPALKNVV